MTTEEEIVRLRERVHDLRAERAGVELRLLACERQLEGFERRVGRLDTDVAALAEADRIAAAVAVQVRKDRRLIIGAGAKVYGALVGIAAFADAALQIWRPGS